METEVWWLDIGICDTQSQVLAQLQSKIFSVDFPGSGEETLFELSFSQARILALMQIYKISPVTLQDKTWL